MKFIPEFKRLISCQVHHGASILLSENKWLDTPTVDVLPHLASFAKRLGISFKP
jgi:hypothetical protein